MKLSFAGFTYDCPAQGGREKTMTMYFPVGDGEIAVTAGEDVVELSYLGSDGERHIIIADRNGIKLWHKQFSEDNRITTTDGEYGVRANIHNSVNTLVIYKKAVGEEDEAEEVFRVQTDNRYPSLRLFGNIEEAVHLLKSIC